MRPGDPRFTALVHCVATGRPPGWLGSAASVEEVGSLAIAHRVVGTFAAALRSEGLPVPADVEAAVTAATADHLRAVRAARRVGEALTGAGLTWALVKGPVLAARWPVPTAARSYQDLDVLVGPADLRTALEALADEGFVERNRNWAGFRRLGVGEVPVDDGEVVVDLHWHLVGLDARRRAVRLPTRELLGRTVEVDVAGSAVPTLCDVDTLVHLCVHDGFAGAQTLVELRDVHLVASGVGAVSARDALRAARAGRLGGVVIDRAERLFGPLSASPLATALSGSPGWVRLNRLVDRTWSAATTGGWTPFPGSVAKAGRSTIPATAGALAAELVDSLAHRTGRATVVAPGGPLDWDVDAGGAAERDRYLEDVSAGRFGS